MKSYSCAFLSEYAFELIIVAFGLATAMQLTLLLKDFPTGVIYECMSEWHRLQLFLHFGGCEYILVQIFFPSLKFKPIRETGTIFRGYHLDQYIYR